MDDEAFYEAVVHELEASGPRKGLWAKAFAAANGNESEAKAYYLKWRAKQLKDEHTSVQDAHRAEAAAQERKKQASAELRNRFRPFALKLRSLGLPIEAVVLQLESRGCSKLDADHLAKEVFHVGEGT